MPDDGIKFAVLIPRRDGGGLTCSDLAENPSTGILPVFYRHSTGFGGKYKGFAYKNIMWNELQKICPWEYSWRQMQRICLEPDAICHNIPPALAKTFYRHSTGILPAFVRAGG